MDPLVAFDKAFELAERIGDLMRAGLAERGLTPARAGLLLDLARAGRPLVQRELADLLDRTPRHITALVDVLERDGFLVREPHPTDRRATLVRLTERGREAAGWMTDERRSAAAAMLGDLDPAALAGFVEVADRLVAGLAPGRSPAV
jgi:DNA-binding MarR family transcriptional regulator